VQIERLVDSTHPAIRDHAAHLISIKQNLADSTGVVFPRNRDLRGAV
jgi:hypothetical protein